MKEHANRESSTASAAHVRQETLYCNVCKQPITDLIYARCGKCGMNYHVICLKKKPSIDLCRHHNIQLLRQE